MSSVITGTPQQQLAINRRGFLAAGSALGLVSAAGWPLSARAQSQPKKGGRLIIGSRAGSTSDSVDPALLTNSTQTMLAFAFCSTLTEVLADGSVGPALAESWETTDARTWQFKIRQGVEFHNGKTMTVEDIIASLNYHRAEESKSFVKPIADRIAEITAPDANSLLIKLSSANVDFPVSLNTAGFTIFPSTEGRIDWKSQVGTGGYILQEYQPGTRAFLKRNPNYWGDGAHFDEVEMLTIADMAARNNALVTGQVDVINGVDLPTVGLLSRKPGIVIEETTGPLHYNFPMDTRVGPFDNIDVRKAMKFAIDRQEIVDKVLLGYGTVGNDNPIGPSYRHYADDIAKNSYDPDRAKFHLKKAGFDNLKIDLSAAEAAYPGAVNSAVLFQQQAARAGIDINVIQVPDDGYWDNVWMKQPFCASFWGGYPTESEIFAIGYAPGAAWNDTFWTQERFEFLRIAAQGELDEGKRGEIYREMQEILRDDGGQIVTCFAKDVNARSEKLAHGPLASNGGLDGERIAERWWMA